MHVRLNQIWCTYDEPSKRWGQTKSPASFCVNQGELCESNRSLAKKQKRTMLFQLKLFESSFLFPFDLGDQRERIRQPFKSNYRISSTLQTASWSTRKLEQVGNLRSLEVPIRQSSIGKPYWLEGHDQSGHLLIDARCPKKSFPGKNCRSFSPATVILTVYFVVPYIAIAYGIPMWQHLNSQNFAPKSGNDMQCSTDESQRLRAKAHWKWRQAKTN